MNSASQKRSNEVGNLPDCVTVVCIRWGKAFSKDYVKALYNGVKSNLSRNIDFVCLSDDQQFICDGVRVLAIPDFNMPKEKWSNGCWPKLTVFKRGLFRADRPVLFLDLDVVILRSLDPILETLERDRGLQIVREWNPILWSFVPLSLRPNRGGQSSLFAFFPEEQYVIYERFIQDLAGAFVVAHNDQMFITRTANRLTYLPYDWSVSFKKHCVKYYPFNLVFKSIRRPRKAMLVIFHGVPKPTDLIGDDQVRWGTDRKFGHGPVPWIKEYWNAGIR